MPYPNEHACRLKEPGAFQDDSFRRVQRKHKGKEYSVIMGKLKGESTMSEQAYRYPKDKWSASEAKSHCSEHGGRFEAAKDTNAQSDINKTNAKEVKTMELETRIKELEDQVKGLELQIVSKDDLIKNLTTENSRLDKELTIVKTNAQADKEAREVEAIMNEILVQSTLSEGLYAKVIRQISPANYRTESGELDKEAFKAAFATEVDDWAKNIRSTGGVGLTEVKTDATTDIASDVEYGKELARSVAGKIRSDG